MEYINIQQAASKAGVSAKTIRRAIHKGTLIDHEPKPNRSKIAVEQLNKYIASRQTPQTEVLVHGHGQKQADRITELENTVASLQQDLGRLQGRVQEFGDLQQRVRELERIILLSSAYAQEIQAADPTPVPAQEQTVSPVPVKKTGRRTKQQGPTVALADFNRLWQDEYKSTAIDRDVKALVVLKPSLGNEPRDYHIAYCDWEPTSVKQVIKDEMRARGELLRDSLLTAVHNALVQHGWIVVDAYHTYRLPNA